MATHASSTPAPARPLLPLSAPDRGAIGRDGWARARALAARLGGAVRDHLAAGMRQAWRAARAAGVDVPCDLSELIELTKVIDAGDKIARRARPAMGIPMTARAELPPEPLLSSAETGIPASAASDRAEEIALFGCRHSDLDPVCAVEGIAPEMAGSTALPASKAKGLGPKTGLEVTTPDESATAADAPRCEIGDLKSEGFPFAPIGSDTAAAAHALHLRRRLEAAAEHGASLLAALGLPDMADRLVGISDRLPRGPLTLAQAEALDFAALWRSLPAGTQASIGALALRNEMMLQLTEDGGFHTTADDREDAQGHADRALDALRPAIWAALPTVMPTVYDEPYPLWQVLDGRHPPAEVDVRGLGLRSLIKDGWQWFARDGGGLVELGGAVGLDSRKEGAACRWQFWTAADIDAERRRRHPEMADAEVDDADLEQDHRMPWPALSPCLPAIGEARA